MTIYFVRHADKQWGDFFNPKLGHQDQPISRIGGRQARRLRRYLLSKEISRVYVSRYIRTHQTIAPFARRARITPLADPRLDEIDLGDIEGMTVHGLESAYPELWRAHTERRADFRFPGGETGGEAAVRIASSLKDQAGQSGNAVAVAHDGIIRLLFCHLLGVPVYKRFAFKLGTTNVLEVQRDDERGEWNVVRFNQELG